MKFKEETKRFLMRECKKTFQNLPRAGDSGFRGHIKGRCRWTGRPQVRKLGDRGQHGSSWPRTQKYLENKTKHSVPQMKTEAKRRRK